AGIAHEINQPLAAIATYAQASRRMLETGTGSLDRVKETVEKIAEQALRAGEVIRRLRQFARRNEGDRQQIDPNVLIQDALRLCEVDSRVLEIPIEFVPARDAPFVRVDAIQIQQVVVNLVRNALESMDGASDGGARVLVRAEVKDGLVNVSVRDRGAGVPREAESELFHPFFTTKRQGMGMGLSICRSIITAHGGKLDFVRNPEGGTTFRFTIPGEGNS
ncbi:MAG: hybrid sensor histidine kinase/response regulator, partial [Gemmatimonadetes bacterium]|nr:hybrid sensor histidine kinase/response regulator [Gemmatimonadota bacterium]